MDQGCEILLEAGLVRTLRIQEGGRCQGARQAVRSSIRRQVLADYGRAILPAELQIKHLPRLKPMDLWFATPANNGQPIDTGEQGNGRQVQHSHFGRVVWFAPGRQAFVWGAQVIGPHWVVRLEC